MARKLEDVLMAKGYSAADLEALKPLLADSKFRGALEDEFGVIEGERDKFKGEAEGWASWYKDKGLPTVEKALQDTQDANARAAAHEARLRTLQEQGLIKVAEGEGEPTPKKEPESVFDPKAHNLVTHEDVAKFADAEGEAIATAQDLAAEYAELFPGKSLFGYQNDNGERGLRALRHEALTAKANIRDYVAGKFKFKERRAEIDQAAAAAREADIRKDERAKAIAEIANPNARPPSSSRFTLLPRPAADGKQPWDNPEERTQARVNKALTHVLQ